MSSYLRHSVTKRIETSLSSKGSKLAGNSLTLRGKQCVSSTCPQKKESKEMMILLANDNFATWQNAVVKNLAKAQIKTNI